MNFTWNISFGQMAVIASMIGGFVHLNYKLNRILFQHELLWWDYCSRRGIDPRSAPMTAAGILARKDTPNAPTS